MGRPERSEPDAELVRRALTGDKEPVAELLTRHWDTACFLAAKVLGSRELARDAVQEAAIAAMSDLDRLRSPDRFGAWFCGITLNVARRWLRQLSQEVPAVAAERASAAPGPAEVVLAADVAARVRAAIAVLPVGQRSAVHLFYLQGLSHREVAAELGISPGAVKARLHQARAALAPRLAEVIDIGDIREAAKVTTTDTATWAEVYVSEIRREQAEDPALRKHIMILAERGSGRQLPIWIGPAEATAMALTLETVETPRPLTYMLAAGLVAAAGGDITEVRITRLESSLFYASVVVRGPEGQREVDARPSDAVNLALAIGVPIRVSRDLIDAGWAAEHMRDLATYPVATADIATEVTRRMEAERKSPGC